MLKPTPLRAISTTTIIITKMTIATVTPVFGAASVPVVVASVPVVTTVVASVPVVATLIEGVWYVH